MAAIEPQLYAAENFHAQRKPPDSLDAWDLVMRALSHFWRVTRQDNVVAQALLEKAISIDPNYGQALGVLANSYMFMRAYGLGGYGNGDADCRTRGTGGDPRRQRGPLGAPRTRQRPSCSSDASTTRWPNSSWRYASIRTSALSAGLLWPGSVLLRALAGSRSSRAARHPLKSARSVCGGLLRHRVLRAVHRPQLRRGDQVGARGRCASATISSGPSRAHRRQRNGRTSRRWPSLHCSEPAPGAAERFARLDRRQYADPARRGTRALRRSLPQGWTGLAAVAVQFRCAALQHHQVTTAWSVCGSTGLLLLADIAHATIIAATIDHVRAARQLAEHVVASPGFFHQNSQGTARRRDYR